MPPRKAIVKRKKSTAATTPTPIDDHKSPTPEVKTGAELVDVAKVKAEDTLGQIEVSNSNPAKIDDDSTTSVAFSPESVMKADVVLENSTVGDTNEARNEDGQLDKVIEDLPLVSEDVDKGKKGVVDGIVCLENDEIDETIDKEKENLQHGSETDQDKQGSGVDDSQLETIAVKVNNEEEKQEIEESNANKEPSNNDAALVIEDDKEDDEESEEGSEGDDAENDDSVPDNKKDKDIQIYVGGLDKKTVEDDLVNVFQQFGELKSTRIVRNINTKKSKGFAFVSFVSSDHAKRALSELKDGVEVRGKLVKISESQDKHTLYLGNISKTWKKEEVSQQLKQYGIENIEMIRLPENRKIEGKNKGYAFLEFNTHSDAVSAFQRLKKPDAIFGCNISCKVSFAQGINQNDEDLSQAKKVYLEGLNKDWNEEKVKEICGKYGEIVKVDLCRNPRTKNIHFGFITFVSNENALACVEGINSAGIGGEVKIKANFAKPHTKGKQGGGFKVEASTSNKKTKIPKKNPQPKSVTMKTSVNSQQPKTNKKDTSKSNTKVPKQKGIIKTGETSKKAELTNKKGESNSQQPNKKRKEQNPNVRHNDTPKKQKFGGEGQNSKSASKPGNQKRKGREDGGNRNVQNKKPFKKQRGNVHGRERDNYRNINSGSHVHIRRVHVHDHNNNNEYRNSSSGRYMMMDHPYNAPTTYSASDAYRLPPDSLSTRRFKEMEPHAGYLEPSSASHSRSYSGYIQQQPPVVRTHNQHQTIYLSPAVTSQTQSQGQSQLYSRYSDRPIMTQQAHGGYIETTAVGVGSQSQPYGGYQQSSLVQIARDPYDSGLPRSAVRHDGRGGGITYVEGPPLPSSQIRDHTSYYQGSGSYSGGYSSQRTYY